MAKSKFPGGRRIGNPAAGNRPVVAKPQIAGAGAAATVAVDTPAPKKRTSPGQFLNEVRAEGRKIVWPSRKETWITSVMVFIMVAIAVVFFWIVDTALGFASTQILRIGQ